MAKINFLINFLFLYLFNQLSTVAIDDEEST